MVFTLSHLQSSPCSANRYPAGFKTKGRAEFAAFLCLDRARGQKGLESTALEQVLSAWASPVLSSAIYWHIQPGLARGQGKMRFANNTQKDTAKRENPAQHWYKALSLRILTLAFSNISCAYNSVKKKTLKEAAGTVVSYYVGRRTLSIPERHKGFVSCIF